MLDEECVKCGAKSDELFLNNISLYSGHSHFEVKTKTSRSLMISDTGLPTNCFRFFKLKVFLFIFFRVNFVYTF